MPQWLQAAVLMDGKLNQIGAARVVLYKAGHFKENGIAVGKLPASCSGLLQPLDTHRS